jgi:dihydropteroate synthase
MTRPMASTSAGRHWAGLSLDRPRVMGILNVTPDSFSDGGRGATSEAAIARGLAMAADGADIIDVGGESTRPGADAVPPNIEQGRIIPVVRALARVGLPISVDTRNATTMRAALDAGARIINDVSGLAHDPDATTTVAAYGCPVVLMHMRGIPATMNVLATYSDVVPQVRDELLARVAAAESAGVARDNIAIDPGIGFAKRAEHAQAILRGLPAFVSLGYPVLIGVSRKAFIGALSNEPQADRRLGGSIAASVFAALRGATIFRVHDVRETVQAFRVWHALCE